MSVTQDNIKFLRKSIGKSQDEFGQLFGVPRTTIASYEHEQVTPKADLAIRISNHFGFKMEDFFNRRLTVEDLKPDKKYNVKEAKSHISDHEVPLYIAKNHLYAMGRLLQIPLDKLLTLQHEERDIEKIKLIQEVITWKQRVEHLESENNLLKQLRDLENSKSRKQK